MPFILLFGLLLLPYVLFFIFIRWLVRMWIITGERIVVICVLPLLAFLDFMFTAPLYVLPKTIWPPFHPTMTWAQVFEWLNYRAPGDSNIRAWYFTLDLFRIRPPGFWLTQLPFALVVFPLLRWAWRSGWPAKKKGTGGYSKIAPGKHSDS